MGVLTSDNCSPIDVVCEWCTYLSLFFFLFITRQMMIIAGGEPELCCRRHAIKREGGVYGRPYALRVREVLSRMQCAHVALV